jgi:hypothetical protein
VVTTIAFSVAIINTLNWDGGGTITGRFALNNSLIEHIYNNPAALIIGGFKASFIDQNRQLPHAFPLYFALTFGVLFAMFLTLYVVRIVITPIIRARNNLTSPLLAPLLCTASSLLVYGLQTSYFDVAVSSTVFFYALANAIVIEKGEPFDTPASITRLENTK